MDELQDKWGEKYPVVIDSWRRNWERLTTYFRYDKSIRKLIYTTNTIERFHRQVRKVTKTKGAFTSDIALLKLIYLAHKNIKKKWTMLLANWGTTAQKLAIWFPGRVVLDSQLLTRGAVIETLTQFVLHSLRKFIFSIHDYPDLRMSPSRPL